MSMLAEKKRKQKWLLNPQGKHWLSDSNKFGLKVLESLGWKEGKGLGKQQDGITEPIKISYKNDNKGLGLKETQRSQQQDHFNNLLESLNNTVSDNSPAQLTSLEKKSQNSRSRVHYKKFTRGKDLSRYSEKDLASIFEKKSNETKTEGSKDSININRGSMTEYFQKKMPSYQINNKPESDSSGDERKVGFGFESFTNPAFEPLGHGLTLVKHKLEPITEIDNEKDASIISNVDKEKNHSDNQRSEMNEYEVKRKSKTKADGKVKKRKKSKACLDENDGDSKKHKGIDNPMLQLNDSIDDSENVQSKTKKKKLQQLQSIEVCGIDNPALDVISVKVKKKKKKVVDNQIVESVPEDTSKVKKRKTLNDTVKLNEGSCEVQERNELENKQTKKKRGIYNPAFNENDVTENTNTSLTLDIPCDLMLNVVEEPVKDVKRKSTKKLKNTGCNNYGFDVKAQRIEENMTSISRTIETYQAEVENDINERKDVEMNEDDLVVGEFSNCDGENEKQLDGVLLRFKYASFKKDPHWVVRYNQSVNFAKKSYKHLIRGDIAVGFKESNLHEIKGYGLGNKL